MKVSEFKKYIREQIIQTLEQASQKDIDMQKAFNDALRDTDELVDKLGMKMENKKKD